MARWWLLILVGVSLAAWFDAHSAEYNRRERRRIAALCAGRERSFAKPSFDPIEQKLAEPFAHCVEREGIAAMVVAPKGVPETTIDPLAAMALRALALIGGVMLVIAAVLRRRRIRRSAPWPLTLALAEQIARRAQRIHVATVVLAGGAAVAITALTRRFAIADRGDACSYQLAAIAVMAGLVATLGWARARHVLRMLADDDARVALHGPRLFVRCGRELTRLDTSARVIAAEAPRAAVPASRVVQPSRSRRQRDDRKPLRRGA